MPDWFPALCLGFVLLAVLVTVQVTRPGVDGQFLIVTDPRAGDLGLMDIAWRAGGGLLRSGTIPGTGIALSDDPGFAARLRSEGAWLVLPNAADLGLRIGREHGMRSELDKLRTRFGAMLVLLFWAHVPVMALAATMTDRMPVWMAGGVSVALALTYHQVWRAWGIAPRTRYLAAVALVGQPALLLLILRGHPWQMDMHMYFFALLALNLGWFDRGALLAGGHRDDAAPSCPVLCPAKRRLLERGRVRPRHAARGHRRLPDRGPAVGAGPDGRFLRRPVAGA